MKYDITHPHIYVRIPKNVSEDFIDLVSDYVINGRNRAQLLCDESVIKALRESRCLPVCTEPRSARLFASLPEPQKIACQSVDLSPADERIEAFAPASLFFAARPAAWSDDGFPTLSHTSSIASRTSGASAVVALLSRYIISIS